VDMTAVVKFTEHDRSRLRADLRAHQSNKAAIAECALDEDSGLWVYMGLRPDKDKPNFITTGQHIRRSLGACRLLVSAALVSVLIFK
jgi:hypothetical protein